VDLLADAGAGVHSALEHRYLSRVERAHRLPAAGRNEAEPDGAGGRVYRDLRYRPWRLVVELDGRGSHPAELGFRDRRRDNRVVTAGDLPLRYGWHEIADDPCGVAAEVAQVLSARGWTGRPRRCGPGCTLSGEHR
jgi:hypothetical protein